MTKLLLIVLFVGCSDFRPKSQPPSSHSRRTFQTQTNKRGVHLLLSDTFRDFHQSVWSQHLEYARSASGEGGYVTQLIRADDLNHERWQYFMDLCAEFGQTPIIRIATSANPQIGGWHAPDSSKEYAVFADKFSRFLAGLDWPEGPHLIVVGNEPNHGNEWGGETRPDEYARFLIAMARALHEADPEAIVMNAGFDHFAPHTNGLSLNGASGGSSLMDAESFIDGMISAEPHVFTYIDAWASHAYPLGALVAPPWEQQNGADYLHGASNPDRMTPGKHIYNRGVNGYEWELQKLATVGIHGLPVFITETGWYNDVPNADIWLDLALRGNGGRYPQFPESGWTPWLEDARVVAITPFAFGGPPNRWERHNWVELGLSGEILATNHMFKAWQISTVEQ